MGSRPSVVVTEKIAVDGGESPNAYVGEVTVQVRVHYPPHVPFEVVNALLREVTFEAYLRLRTALPEDASTTGT